LVFSTLMNKLKRFDHAGTPRFVTFSCYHNYNLFKTEEVKDQFILTVKGCATRGVIVEMDVME
ncbi:MAG: hypothetical protein AB1744_03745, partial [Candidatus Zixiibacteriota bacterium]